MKIEFTADMRTFDAKPNQQEAARISGSLKPVYVESVEEFVEDMQHGRTWSPSNFNGSRSNANWIGQSILALDVDGGLTPGEAIQRMRAYELTPNAWYPTFSDSPAKRKFRLIFFLDTFITDIDARNYLMDGLFALYPEADRACKDPAHIFYGTNKNGQVLNSKALPLDLFLTVLESDKIKNGARLRNIDPQKAGAAFLRKIGETEVSYSNTIGDLQKATPEQKKNYYESLKKINAVKLSILISYNPEFGYFSTSCIVSSDYRMLNS